MLILREFFGKSPDDARSTEHGGGKPGQKDRQGKQMADTGKFSGNDDGEEKENERETAEEAHPDGSVSGVIGGAGDGVWEKCLKQDGKGGQSAAQEGKSDNDGENISDGHGVKLLFPNLEGVFRLSRVNTGEIGKRVQSEKKVWNLESSVRSQAGQERFSFDCDQFS
jgi:hypothetical protein